MNLTSESSETIEQNSTLYDFEVFDSRDLLSVLAYTVMSIVGILGNSWVLLIARRQSNKLNMRTNVHYLVFHLTVADAITCFITTPMETVWRATVEWYAGNIVCKGLMMVRTGGYILSSNMLVVLAIDRYISFSHPLNSINTLRQRKRARLLVVFAWLITVVSTVPQAIIFRVLKHPERDFYQCTTINFFEDLASPVHVGNTTVLYYGGLKPAQWANLYHSLFNCEVFFGPLIAMIISYIKIFSVICRKSGETLKQLKSRKGLMRALKMSLVHVVVFVLCWTPYTTMATWEMLDQESASQVPEPLQDILFLTACLNSCINPLIYGGYYYTESKKPDGDSESSRMEMTMATTTSRESFVEPKERAKSSEE